MRAKSVGTADSNYMIETFPGCGWGLYSTDVRVFATSAARTAAIQFIVEFVFGRKT